MKTERLNITTTTKFTDEQLDVLLNQLRFDLNQEPPKEDIIFRIDWQTIGSLGDYGLLTGKPKAGKTKYLAAAIAAAISRMEIFGMTIKLPDNKLRGLHIDTEQGKRSHFNLLKLITQLSGIEQLPAYFDSLHCRQQNADRIMLIIEHYLQRYPDTGILFLDGLLDLIANFNDVIDSKRLVDWLKRITEANNVYVFAVLHRGVTVDKSIGQVGSSLDRAAQSVLIVEKNRETKQYILKHEYLRDAEGFDEIAIHYNKQLEIWERTDYIDGNAGNGKTGGKVSHLLKRKPHEYDISEHLANCTRIFNSQGTLTYIQLREEIKQVYVVGREWAGHCINHLISSKVIFKNAEGMYTNIQQGVLSLASKNT